MAITVKDQIFSLETANTLYQMKADSFGVVKHLWYGEKTGVSMEYLLDYPDVGFSGNIYEAENDRTYSLNTMPLEYAGSGVGDFRVPAVTVRHADGSQALDLRFQKYFIRKGKYSIPGLPAVYAEENEAETLEILMKDTASETEVHLFYGVLEEADVIIYAGSLVNPQLLEYSKDVCTIHNSAKMTLEEVISVMERAEAEGKMTVRLHTGDPCIYGAIREQMDILDEKGIPYDSCPGVSAFCGAASALNLEYTLPDISQSVIITRMEGRTPVPAKESIQSFAAHNATMVIFLSTGMLEELSRRLVEGGYREDTPAAIVYKATWPDEKKFICTVGTLAQTAKENKITKTALMLVGDAVNAASYDRSKLYDPGFTTEFREATK